jgi:hypothetical protein
VSLQTPDQFISTRAAYGRVSLLLVVAWGYPIRDALTFAVHSNWRLSMSPGGPRFSVDIAIGLFLATIMALGAAYFAVGREKLGLARGEAKSAVSWVETLTWGSVGMLTCGSIGVVLNSWLSTPGGEMSAPSSNPSVMYNLVGGILAGPHEEPVVVAVIVILLSAKRPSWEIYGTVIIARCLFHAEFGPARLISVALMASLIVWLYLKHRNLPALMVAHAASNTANTLHAMSL